MFHWFPRVINQITLYDLVSGWLSLGALLVAFGTTWRRWNCNQRGCLRHGHPHGDHGRPVCSFHYHSYNPHLGERA